MTRDDFDLWIENYGKAWSTLDSAAVLNMLDRDNLEYHYDQFKEPKRTWDEVKALWDPVATNQKDVTFRHEILMVDGNAVLAHVNVTRTLLPSGEQEDIDAAFMFTINEKGRCTYFRQWRVLG